MNVVTINKSYHCWNDNDDGISNMNDNSEGKNYNLLLLNIIDCYHFGVSIMERNKGQRVTNNSSI